MQLSLAQLRAVKLLIQGKCAWEIAEDVGITTEEFYQWIRLPEFNQAVKALNEDIYKAGMNDLNQNIKKAVNRLTSIIEDEMVSTTNHLKAIEILFRQVNMLREFGHEIKLDELESKITELSDVKIQD